MDKIIENIQETKSKINILSDNLHPLLEEINKNLKGKNIKENLTYMKKEEIKDKENNTDKDIENIEKTLNSKKII